MTTPNGFTKISRDYDDLPVAPKLQGNGSGAGLVEGSFNTTDSFAEEDTVLANLDNVLEQYFREEQVNQSVVKQGPQGGSGSSIYAEKNTLNPELQSPFHAASLAYKTLQGTTKIIVERLAAWAENLLHGVHSHKANGNSEVKIIENISTNVSTLFSGINLSAIAAISRYKTYLDEAGKHQATSLEGQLSDYTYGNSVVRTNNIRQYEVGQFRVQAGNLASIEAPTISFATQQIVTQARFNHINADLQQQSHLHYWLRAEDVLSQIGTNTYRVNVNSLIETAPNRTAINGGVVYYADSEFRQYGQQSNSPIHATRAKNPANMSYGQCTHIAYNNYNITSNAGSINLLAGGSIVINAPLVLINPMGSGSSSSSGSSSNNATPQVFNQLVDPEPYKKAEPAEPTGRLSINNQTPEPPITPSGPNLGGF